MRPLKPDSMINYNNQKRRTRIQEENQEKILDAALTVFSQFGYRGSTVAQIATESGMSKANLLYYFRRKQDIYVAVLENTLEQWLDPLQGLDPDGDPITELCSYVNIKFAMSRRAPAASRIFAMEILHGASMITPFLENELKTLVDAKCAVLQRWIDQKKLVPIEPIHLLFIIWAATQHYADFRTQIDVLTNTDEDSMYRGAELTLRAMLQGLATSDA